MLCNSFCTSANPNTWVSCRIRGSEWRIVYLLVALGWVGQRGEKRRREVVKTAFYPLLSCFLSFTSFTPLLLPKAGKRSKEANMKGIPEILFFAALSCCSLHYRYGNAESQIQPVPRLQSPPCLIWLSLSFPFSTITLLAFVLPLLHHLLPSSALASL